MTVADALPADPAEILAADQAKDLQKDAEIAPLEELAGNGRGDDEPLTAVLGRRYMIPSAEVVTTSEAQIKSLQAFEKGSAEWQAYQAEGIPEEEMKHYQEFVIALLQHSFRTEDEYDKAIRAVRKQFQDQPSKPNIVRAYYRLREAGAIAKHAIFERVATKKAVRSNSGVVVITVLTAPGRFSCPQDCHYCPNEPGQPRSYLSTEPAVARANQNEFDPVRQFYDRAGTLAKQGHTVDKVEIIVLGGTWSGYPRDYQEEFCRDLFYAANTFDEAQSKLGQRGEAAAHGRKRLSILEEQKLNERAQVKIIGLTLETRPDHVSWPEVRRLRRYGCTRVQIGVQHTDDDVLRQVNRGHERHHAVSAVHILKTCGFKVDLHLMPDLPGSDPEKDLAMFNDILHTPDLQADHWKIYPCEVTPWTKIEQWYKEGLYVPYTERDPQQLIDVLAKVKAQVHPWIRLNRVIRDIPEVSIIAGNQITNLRQAIFAELKKMGKSCRCIRCREVRDWPEAADGLRVRIREYRSSSGTEFFISIEGGDRGLGGGATKRGLAGGKKQRPTKAEKRQKREAAKVGKGAGKGASGETSERVVKVLTRRLKTFLADEELDRLPLLEESFRLFVSRRGPPTLQAEAAAAADGASPGPSDDAENATLYGLLRLRLNDDGSAPGRAFPELRGCALIRELHVYGVLVAARQGESKGQQGTEERPQHGGIGRTLMATAERLAASRGWGSIAVIAGVGVRNYYRRLGYRQRGDGQYLIKELQPCEPTEVCALEMSFLDAAAFYRRLEGPLWQQVLFDHRRALVAAAAAASLAAGAVAVLALGRRWRAGSGAR